MRTNPAPTYAFFLTSVSCYAMYYTRSSIKRAQLKTHRSRSRDRKWQQAGGGTVYMYKAVDANWEAGARKREPEARVAPIVVSAPVEEE